MTLAVTAPYVKSLIHSSTLNTFGLSFTKNLNWQFHISTLAKSACKKLGVLWHLRPFLSPSQLLALYRGLIRPCMEYGSHVWEGSILTVLLNRVESKAFRLINSSPLTDCLYLSSTVIFLLTALLNLLTECLPYSRGLAAQHFLFLLILILSIYLMQELTSIFSLSSLTLFQKRSVKTSLILN